MLTLPGRAKERTALDRLLEAACAGQSGALVLWGEAGVGKSALLECAIGSASDMVVGAEAGMESEMQLAFAALHHLCAPLLDRLDTLPAQQRHALAFALGLGEGPVPDGFFGSLAAATAAAELVEAAARCGHPEFAGPALERIAETARASATEWALGIEARSRALLTNGDAAETLYREAIERLGRTRMRVQLARAHLLFGEWLRRERRRRDAREQLRIALEMFTAVGADAFAARAERELLATGERVRKRSVETRDALTAQEAQVARLARDGLSNAEIGVRLFISGHTVAYHMRKVFGKLDITSRNQLARVLRESAETARVP